MSLKDRIKAFGDRFHLEMAEMALRKRNIFKCEYSQGSIGFFN
jgi:hypothetical protein